MRVAGSPYSSISRTVNTNQIPREKDYEKLVPYHGETYTYPFSHFGLEIAIFSNVFLLLTDTGPGLSSSRTCGIVCSLRAFGILGVEFTNTVAALLGVTTVLATCPSRNFIDDVGSTSL